MSVGSACVGTEALSTTAKGNATSQVHASNFIGPQLLGTVKGKGARDVGGEGEASPGKALMMSPLTRAGAQPAHVSSPHCTHAGPPQTPLPPPHDAAPPTSIQ